MFIFSKLFRTPLLMMNFKQFTLIGLLVFTNSYCNDKQNNVNVVSEKSDSIIKSTQNSLTENQKKVLSGAKENLKQGASYDLSMAYYVLKYKNGEYVGEKIFPEGDIDPKIGVCTDVIVRSLRLGNVIDLQEAVNTDINTNLLDYPLSRWGKKKADSNIDHRRVINLEVWFEKYWEEGNRKDIQPGDIVVWDMNQDGASDHIGIVSDKKEERYFVIHNHPDPGYIAEEDKLFKWKIVGHYRIN